MTPKRSAELSKETETVFTRRMEAAMKMFAGEASYDDVLAFHAEDFIWMSPAGTICGHDAARQYNAARVAQMPLGALSGLKIKQVEIYGEYVFIRFRTDLIPFGTDTFIIRDGKVAFQSNALYVPRSLVRPDGTQMKTESR